MEEKILPVADAIASHMQDATASNANGNEHIAQTLRDRKGREFNPDIHVTDENGKPILLNDGSIKSKRGRRSGSVSHVHKEAPASADESAAAGAAIAESIFLLCRSIGGEAFTPIERDNINERAMMTSAWQRYCEAKGISEIPPSLFVGVAMMTYVGPRLSEPTVRERIGGAFGRLRNWWRNRKARKAEAAGFKSPDKE